MNLLDNSPYWTKQRRELVSWLNDRVPSFTEGYVGAVHLLHSPSFPGRVHLVCHVVRDIYRYLPAALGDKSPPRPSEVYPKMVKDLAKLWEQFPSNGPKEENHIGLDMPINPRVYAAVQELVVKSRELQNSSYGKRLVIALCRAQHRRNDEFIHPWIISSFNEEYQFFVSRAHLAMTLKDMPTDDGLMEHFERFERAFHSLVGSYFSGKEELDAILRETNPATD